MPEAVIVATARTPIGRAFKGSLKDLRPDNLAFAAQVIPSYRDLGIDINRLNVNGGAIAVGHPFGMTGARITTTLINSLQFHDKQFGLETMCVGGGQGMALVLERLS
jgi:acetyl-CoA C-acetyltransferase